MSLKEPLLARSVLQTMLHILGPEFATRTKTPLLVRLLRIWQFARMRQDNPLPAMTNLTGQFDCSQELATASDSCFVLTEACLNRRLITAQDTSGCLTSDESALIVMVNHAPLLSSLGPTASLPHGLPGALQWSIMAVVRALGPLELLELQHWNTDAAQVVECPFVRPERQSAGWI